jgi:hypothetical protein
MRSPEWGTQLGRLYLAEKISPSQYEAGRKWVELVASYEEAMDGPRRPSCVELDRRGGGTVDPDSEPGQRTAKRHCRVTVAYVGAFGMLSQAGAAAAGAVRNVVEYDRACSGWMELQALKVGLQTLAACWAAGRKR